MWTSRVTPDAHRLRQLVGFGCVAVASLLLASGCTSAEPSAGSTTRPTAQSTGTDPASSTTLDGLTPPDTAVTTASDGSSISSSWSTPATSSIGSTSTETTPPDDATYFSTLPLNADLPSDEECAALVFAAPSTENKPENSTHNETTVDVSVDIDGADEFWNGRFAPRITGNFTGTTEQILRWGACKWGFDEDVTRARAVTESSWVAAREGDESSDPAECALIGFEAPCPQSFGLLQVKSTVHVGTYPAVRDSSAFGVDYAMGWLRSCYEGSFTWLGDEYMAGDELACVGAWFSGEWWDQAANDYVGEVRFHLQERTWESYGG